MDWTPAALPERNDLEGDSVRLEPLKSERHAQPLHEISHGPDCDPALWQYMSVGPFAEATAFAAWISNCAAASDPLSFALVDKATGKPFGMASYLRLTPQHRVIEIGQIWFGRPYQRTRQATEAIYLLARHAFDDLGYRRLEWKCDASNCRSRRAAERFGFRFEGVFRQHMLVKGRNRDTAWYAILDGEWGALRAAFEAWLAPDNFDAVGQQRRSLAVIRNAAKKPLENA